MLAPCRRVSSRGSIQPSNRPRRILCGRPATHDDAVLDDHYHLDQHRLGVDAGDEDIHLSTPIGLQTGSLVVNYGSYIYQQQTGSDAAHMEGDKVQAAVFV